MAKNTVTIANVRAQDIEHSDIILVDGRWRQIHDIFADEAHFERIYGEKPSGERKMARARHMNPTPGEYTVYADAAKSDGTIADAFAMGYVVFRIAYDDTSDGGSFDDRLVVANPFDLFQVQVLSQPEVRSVAAVL